MQELSQQGDDFPSQQLGGSILRGLTKGAFVEQVSGFLQQALTDPLSLMLFWLASRASDCH